VCVSVVEQWHSAQRVYSECDYQSEIGGDVSRVDGDERKLIELGSSLRVR